jgi:glycogen operon protein
MSVSRLRVSPGKPYPLGANWDGKGVNFAIFSAHAERVVLCLFDDEGKKETHRIPMPECTNEVWHVYLPEVRPGQLYGYRVFGPYEPHNGHRFNHHKLLMDPYGKSFQGKLKWNPALLGYDMDSDKKDLSFNRQDSAAFVPKSVVVDNAHTWGGDVRPNVSWSDTIVYECHTRGLTMLHPSVPKSMRGTFAGIAQPEVVEYLQKLGISSIELLPIHAFFGDQHLMGNGLCNYWGYDPLNYFSLEPRYSSSSDSIGEFKSMVRVLHDAGIEVILDVVYNHTGEGNHLGPTLSYRGVDNASYYKLYGEDRRYYEDSTGCGASFNASNPRVLQLIMDSLRYWVTEMHVDGFRFDLSTTIAREDHGFSASSGFLDAVGQDPVLQGVKLIAEPWDLGMGGYQVGNFPPGWAEWNDRYRDTLRRFWRGDEKQIADLASRITGSSDIFGHRSRRPWSSVNFITAHDGFCMRDLVSYNHKHNMVNGENNRDGSDANWSWNCGVEGDTDNPKIKELRLRRIKSMMASLLLSQGTPMICAGDEFGRTQRGNNNPYCQDNVISWLNWQGIDEEGRDLLGFIRKVIRIRRRHSVFGRQLFLRGEEIQGTKFKDITWFKPNGDEMVDTDWGKHYPKSISFLLCGAAGNMHFNEEGELSPDRTFFVVMNAYNEDIEWTLPAAEEHESWKLLFDTSRPYKKGEHINYVFGDKITAPPMSFILLEGNILKGKKDKKSEVFMTSKPIATSAGLSEYIITTNPLNKLVATTEELDNVISSSDKKDSVVSSVDLDEFIDNEF